MTATQVRQPAGVPIGGEFAVSARPESDVTLEAPDVQVVHSPAYDFPATRLDEAIARIEAANKKLARAGIDERFTYTTEEYLKHTTADAYGFPQDTYELRTKLELNEPSFSYGGWTFVAALDATENGFIARTAPGQSLDGWRPDAQRCDHCGLARHRKATYILDNADGDRKQIGSNCLEPFLGVEVKGLWALGYDFDGLSDLEDDPDGRDTSAGSGDSAIPTRELIATALAVSDGGAQFVSRGHADEWGKTSTATAVHEQLYGRPRNLQEAEAKAEISQRADGYLKDGTADAVLAAAQAVETDSDYGYNLQVATAGEWVSPKHSAIAISAISVWRRGQERAAAKASITPGFIAPEKAKIAGIKATVTKVMYMDNPYDYNGGVNTLVMFQTPDGHQVKWFASGRKELEIGDTGTFTGGSVKEHASYKGTDQTVVTRVKFDTAA